jgi:hypothetical protein
MRSNFDDGLGDTTDLMSASEDSPSDSDDNDRTLLSLRSECDIMLAALDVLVLRLDMLAALELS